MTVGSCRTIPIYYSRLLGWESNAYLNLPFLTSAAWFRLGLNEHLDLGVVRGVFLSNRVYRFWLCRFWNSAMLKSRDLHIWGANSALGSWGGWHMSEREWVGDQGSGQHVWSRVQGLWRQSPLKILVGSSGLDWTKCHSAILSYFLIFFFFWTLGKGALIRWYR